MIGRCRRRLTTEQMERLLRWRGKATDAMRASGMSGDSDEAGNAAPVNELMVQLVACKWTSWRSNGLVFGQ